MIRANWQAGESGHVAEHNNISALLNGSFNFQAYGFLPSNTIAQNDAVIPAILEAMRTGGIWYIPPGAYRYSVSIAIPVGMNRWTHLLLIGSGSSTLLQYWGPGDAISQNGMMGSGVHIGIRDFQLLGIGISANQANGIHLKNLVNAELRNLWIEDFGGSGLWIDGPECSLFDNIWLRACTIGTRLSKPADGLMLDPNQNIFINYRADYCGTGWLFDIGNAGSGFIGIYGGAFQSNNIGVDFNGGMQIVFRDVWFENNQIFSIRTRGESISKITFDNCLIDSIAPIELGGDLTNKTLFWRCAILADINIGVGTYRTRFIDSPTKGTITDLGFDTKFLEL